MKNIKKLDPGFAAGYGIDISSIGLITVTGGATTAEVGVGASLPIAITHDELTLNVMPEITVPEDITYTVTNVTLTGFILTVTNGTAEAATIAYTYSRTSIAKIV